MTYEQANVELRSRLRHLKARMDAIVDIAEAALVDEDRIEIIRDGLDDLTSRLMVGQEAVRRSIARGVFRSSPKTALNGARPTWTPTGLSAEKLTHLRRVIENVVVGVGTPRICLVQLDEAVEREADAINRQAAEQ